MADNFGQTIQGLHLNGDTISATDQHGAVFGKDSTGAYRYFSLDSNGQLELAHDVNTNPLYSVLTNGTDDLSIYNDGDVAATGTGLMGKDTAGNMRFLKTTVNGELIVDIGSGDSAYTYASASAVKDTPTTVVTESPTSDTIYRGVHVTGFGLAEWEVKFGVTSSESTILAANTTPSHPTHYIPFPSPLVVSSGETILVSVTNRENGNSPNSDFTAKATLIKEA